MISENLDLSIKLILTKQEEMGSAIKEILIKLNENDQKLYALDGIEKDIQILKRDNELNKERLQALEFDLKRRVELKQNPFIQKITYFILSAFLTCALFGAGLFWKAIENSAQQEFFNVSKYRGIS